MIDLDNPEAPLGGSRITLSVDSFMRWMERCRYQRGTANPNQEVYFISTRPTVYIGSHSFVPNWHITAMTTYRKGGDCRNFHFKLEIGKAASHYWHYVIHRDTTGNLVWVGDPNPQIEQTNEGGGGAAGDYSLLKENKTRAISQARIYDIDSGCSKKTQSQMIRVLQNMINNRDLVLNEAEGRIDTDY